MEPESQMQAVLNCLDELSREPIGTLSPEEARRQPTVADAVREVLWQEGSTLSPEPVGAVEDVEVPGPYGPIPLRIYWPLGSDRGALPVLVYAHGGGWVIADLDTSDASCRALVNRAGCIIVSVGYRRAPEHPFPVAHDEVLAATQWVMATIGELSGDPERVAVGGEGSGANMAIATSRSLAMARGRRPVFQLLVYPVTDLSGKVWPSYGEHRSARPLNTPMLEWFTSHVTASARDRFDARLSPMLTSPAALSGMPPTVIMSGEGDPLRDQAEAFGLCLLEAGVNATTLRFQGVPHEFLVTNPVVGRAQEAISLAAKHLRQAFGLRGEAASGVTPDLVQVMEAAQAGLAQLLTKLEQGAHGLVHHMAASLSDHKLLHQEVLGPALAEGGRTVEAQAGLATKSALLGPVVTLQQHQDQPGTDSYEAALSQLILSLSEHLVEERAVLASLTETLDRDRLNELGRRALDIRCRPPSARAQGEGAPLAAGIPISTAIGLHEMASSAPAVRGT